jgi:hypothetical protein
MKCVPKIDNYKREKSLQEKAKVLRKNNAHIAFFVWDKV